MRLNKCSYSSAIFGDCPMVVRAEAHSRTAASSYDDAPLFFEDYYDEGI